MPNLLTTRQVRTLRDCTINLYINAANDVHLAANDISYMPFTGSTFHDYRCLAKCPCPSTTIQDLYATLTNSGKTAITLCIQKCLKCPPMNFIPWACTVKCKHKFLATVSSLLPISGQLLNEFLIILLQCGMFQPAGKL